MEKENLYILLEKSEPSFPQEQGSVVASLRAYSIEEAVDKFKKLLTPSN